jgi:DNA end-binding protein Ku
LAMARQLVESLGADFEPAKYHDTYREQVLDLIERKAAGEGDIEMPTAQPSPAAVVDLLAALEASVEKAKAARVRHPTSKAAKTAKSA